MIDLPQPFIIIYQDINKVIVFCISPFQSICNLFSFIIKSINIKKKLPLPLAINGDE